jgi:hypothetical protein
LFLSLIYCWIVLSICFSHKKNSEDVSVSKSDRLVVVDATYLHLVKLAVDHVYPQYPIENVVYNIFGSFGMPIARILLLVSD